MNRLTIRWDTDVAAEALRLMRISDVGLGDSLTSARATRQALDEASPDNNSRVLNMLLAEFDATMKSLEESKQSLETIIEKTQEANRNFQNATDDIDRIIAALMPGMGLENACLPRPAVERIHYNVEPWHDYQPYVMPGMRGQSGRFVPDWLEAIMNNTDLYQDWMQFD